MDPWNSSSGGSAYIRQSKWVGTIAIKNEGTEIHFLSDALVVVASLDLKVPYVVRVPVHCFNTASHFHLALVAASISHFVTAATKFSCCSSDKKMFPFFISLALDLQLCRPFSRWASLACSLLSLSLCFSPALYSKFVNMTINLNSYFRQHGYRNNFRFPFLSLLTLQLSLLYKTPAAMRFPAKITWSYILAAIPVD